MMRTIDGGIISYRGRELRTAVRMEDGAFVAFLIAVQVATEVIDVRLIAEDGRTFIDRRATWVDEPAVVRSSDKAIEITVEWAARTIALTNVPAGTRTVMQMVELEERGGG